MSVRVDLLPVAQEAAAKRRAMLRPAEEALKDLLALCESRLGADAAARTGKAAAYAAALPSTDPNHPPMSAYLSHPLRVAGLVLRLQASPSADAVELGILHNVYEVAGLDESRLRAAGYGERMARGVRLLTVDRRFETDPAYLESFHREIETFGEDLALVRVCDKLDNLLGLELMEEGALRSGYLDLALRWVGPVAERLSPELGRYFRETAEHMRAAGCRTEERLRYERLLAEAAPGDRE